MSDPGRYTDDYYENSRRIAKWLSAPDPSTNHSRAHQQHLKGTGLWFIQSDAFEEWKRQPGSFLWLYGDAGCGKTVLTSTIIEHLWRDTTCQVLLYFYFDLRDTDKQSLDSLLRSLITQLCRKLPEASQPLDQLWASLSGGPKQRSTESLQNVLRSLLSQFSNVSIVLDALDESTTRHELLSWLQTLVGNNTTDCRLLVTSRREKDITLALQRWTRAQDRISIHGEEVNRDVSAYIEHKVRNGDELGRWHNRSDVLDEIEFHLVENADGMFRWAALQIEVLKNCTDTRSLLNVLSDIHTTLDEKYAQILESIPKDHVRQATTILRLLVWSQRPLRLEEMVDAVAIDLETSPAFDPRNRTPYPRDILRSCQGLLMLDGGDQEGKLQVQLAHSSMREFLLSDRAHAILGSRLDQSSANAQLAKICLAYLSSVTAHSLSLEDLKSQFPFAQYSATYWSDHVREAKAADDVLLDVVVSFLNSGNAAFGTCYRLFDPDRPEVSMSDNKITELPDPLYVASLLGLDQAVEKLIQSGSEFNAKCGLYGNPLHAASFAGYHSIVGTLLSAGADVNAEDEEYGTALHIASLNGFVKVVQVLLERGADINAQSKNYGTAFQVASDKGHKNIVRILLNSDDDVPTADQPARASKYQDGKSDVTYSEFYDSGYSSGQSRPIVDRGADLRYRKKNRIERWKMTRELRTSHGKVTTKHSELTILPAINSSERYDDQASRTEHFSGPDSSLNVLPFEALKTGPARSGVKYNLTSVLAVLKQTISRPRELMILTGLILGPLEPGYTRITWKTKLGHKYTSDVKELKTGGISRTFGNLARSRGIKIVSMGNTTETAGNTFWTALSNKIVQWTSKKTQKSPLLPRQTPVASLIVQPRARLSHTKAGDILMICMQGGKYHKNIYQEDLYVRNIDNDQALFGFLKNMYITHRGALRSRLSLRTIKELKLVEFRLPKNRRPFIPYLSCPTNTCRCLPPEDRILPLGAEYRCTSSGGGGDICPPVPAHVLTDYYENTDSVDPTDTWLIELMPKRVCGRLEGKSTEPAQGWGISYEEGWDHEKIGLVLLIVFFGGSLLFGVFWTVFKNDIQGAFGVSAWWLGASTILLGYVAIRADDR